MILSDYKPQDGVIAYDGRRPDPLHVMNRHEYQLCLEALPEPSYLVMKVGSEVVFHRGEARRTAYSVERIVGEGIEAKRRGLAATIVFSGVCAMGRSVRNRKGDYIGRDELEERRKDARACGNKLENMFRDALTKYGEKPVFLYVTPEDFLSADSTSKIVGFCLSNMAKGRIVFVNERDAERQLSYYPENLTFNENDGLSSRLAREFKKRGDADTWLMPLMDKRGMLPAAVIMNRLMYKGPEDDYVIRLVTNTTGLENEAVTDKTVKSSAAQTRITRGGLPGKIKAARAASKDGVTVVMGSGMFPIHDSNHMRTGGNTQKRHNPVSSAIGRLGFGTVIPPEGLFDEIPHEEERELALV